MRLHETVKTSKGIKHISYFLETDKNERIKPFTILFKPHEFKFIFNKEYPNVLKLSNSLF